MPRTDRGARDNQRQRAALQSLGPMLATTSVQTGAVQARYGEMVLCDPTSGGFTVTLPRATDHRDEVVGVKNASLSAGTITVAPLFGELIDLVSGISFARAGTSLVFMSDGANWLIVWDYAGAGSSVASVSLVTYWIAAPLYGVPTHGLPAYGIGVRT